MSTYTASNKPVVTKYIVTEPSGLDFEFTKYAELVSFLREDPCVEECLRESAWDHMEGCKCEGCFDEALYDWAWEYAEEDAVEQCGYKVTRVLEEKNEK